jgi:hypothetical protein
MDDTCMAFKVETARNVDPSQLAGTAVHVVWNRETNLSFKRVVYVYVCGFRRSTSESSHVPPLQLSVQIWKAILFWIQESVYYTCKWVLVITFKTSELGTRLFYNFCTFCQIAIFAICVWKWQRKGLTTTFGQMVTHKLELTFFLYPFWISLFSSPIVRG